MQQLMFPQDLQAWQAWQASRQRLHAVRRVRRTPAAQQPCLMRGGPRPRLLVVLDSLSPSNVAALLRPLEHLPLEQVAVLAGRDVRTALPEHPWTADAVRYLDELPSLAGVLSAGHYTALGSLGWQAAADAGAAFWVVQHGIVTPLAPPLAEGAWLLAWSDADADFWWSGRAGRAEVVGPQLLWEAAEAPAQAVDDDVPTYLGQLHGAELTRREAAGAAWAFCRDGAAVYRPHPSESDVLSRAQHAVWRRRGMRFDTSGRPLARCSSGIVSVFSTGVLEAAARGLPAWVYFHAAPVPRWLPELWERYAMQEYGSPPTPAPVLPERAPAMAVATVMANSL